MQQACGTPRSFKATHLFVGLDLVSLVPLLVLAQDINESKGNTQSEVVEHGDENGKQWRLQVFLIA